MKVSRVYELWVGGDMVEDNMSLDQALALARIEFAAQQKTEDPVDVVLDEHTYVEFEHEEDLDTVDFVPKWRGMDDTQS